MANKQEHIACHDCDFYVYLSAGYSLTYRDRECLTVLHPNDSLHFAVGLNDEGTPMCPHCLGDLYYDDEPEE